MNHSLRSIQNQYEQLHNRRTTVSPQQRYKGEDEVIKIPGLGGGQKHLYPLERVSLSLTWLSRMPFYHLLWYQLRLHRMRKSRR
jgi:hypothetical protein